MLGEDIGFNILSGGRYFGGFEYVGEVGYFYTSTDGGYPNSYKNMTYTPGVSVSLSAASSSGIKNSCRCIKN